MGCLLTMKFFRGGGGFYAVTIGFSFLMVVITVMETANIKFDALENVLTTYLPMHTLGLSCVGFAAVGYILGLIWMKVVPEK